MAEVEDLLKNVDPTKSTGSDGIPGLVLRQSATVTAPTLQIIFNTSLCSGYVPKSFKLSHVSPLYKSGDKATASNYRPISLLPIVSRLLETIVKSTLVGYLSALNLLPASQFAYRQKHSTDDALVYAVDRWLSARADHKTTGIVMIDMSKAFDRDDHAHIETPELCTSTSSSASKSSSIPVGEDLEKPCEPNATLQYSLLPVKAKRKSNMDLTTSNPGKRSTRATYWSKELMIHASDHFDIVNGHPLSGAIINVASPEVAT